MGQHKRRMPTYTKKDVAKKVAEVTHEKMHAAEKWTDSVFTALRQVLMSADPELRVEVRDFGVLEVKLTKSKPKARNPKTGEHIYVPPRRKTHFKPSKLLKEFLQEPIDPKLFEHESTEEPAFSPVSPISGGPANDDTP
ncbi:MAG TPA: HU family DNA-binding protein [Bacteroidota bacterium]